MKIKFRVITFNTNQLPFGNLYSFFFFFWGGGGGGGKNKIILKASWPSQNMPFKMKI